MNIKAYIVDGRKLVIYGTYKGDVFAPNAYNDIVIVRSNLISTNIAGFDIILGMP